MPTLLKDLLGTGLQLTLASCLVVSLITRFSSLAVEVDSAAENPPKPEPVYGVLPLRDGSGYLALRRNGAIAIAGLGSSHLFPMNLSGADVTSFSQSPLDGNLLIGNMDGGLSLVSPERTESATHLGVLPRSITSVAYSPDGSRICAGCADGLIGIWDQRSGDHWIWRVSDDSGSVFVDFVGDGSRVAVLGEHGRDLVGKRSATDFTAAVRD